ncbi:AraC family transcriptional regulator [Xylophilus sp. Leaf220]|uniref:AraC family transcriptional regulator n=1 Tax=Xylophilus sp. Leaf220 TaxID=1735686 RepID=UPI0006FDC44A|nr:AraC family transcriptional regulator [Xylophilus sp. Leaf220]KQM80449.1 AraC family transcriptional regulator [Xylophilus sp. Leaf220]
MTRTALLPSTLPPGPAAATPMAFVQAICAGYARYGQDPAAALRQARIAPQQLADPAARITSAQFETLSGAAMQALDDEALGWFSRRLPWGSYGMLCRASVTAPTLGVALQRWCRHHALLTDDVRLHLQAGRDHAVLRIEECQPLGALREFCLLTLLRYLHGFACWAVDSRIALREAAFPFPAPPHADVYPLLFPGPIRFGADAAGTTFDAQYLALPLVRDEAATRAMLQRALPLTVRQYRRDRLLVDRVRELLQQAPRQLAHAEGLAARLHISARTLHRQLREEGASLQSLKDTVRRDMALDLLRRTARPIKQVALAVGFQNEKSFARAFRGWTGQGPGAFRQEGPHGHG